MTTQSGTYNPESRWQCKTIKKNLKNIYVLESDFLAGCKLGDHNQGKAQGLKKDKIRCTEYEASVIKLRLRWQLLERDGDPSFTWGMERVSSGKQGIQNFVVTCCFFSSLSWVTGCPLSYILMSLFCTSYSAIHCQHTATFLQELVTRGPGIVMAFFLASLPGYI